LASRLVKAAFLQTGGSGFKAAVLYQVRDTELVLPPDIDMREQSFERVKDLKTYGLSI